MNSSSAFTSPMGPLHLAHPSQMPSFVIPLPSSLRIRSFFRSSSSPSPLTNAPSSQKKKTKHEKLQVEYEYRKGGKSTFTPLGIETKSPSCPPPPYRQANEEDLYCEDVVVEVKENEEDKKRREIVEEDRRMGEALTSFGF